MTNASYETVGSTVIATLLASDFPVITKKVTIAAGENLIAGTVLGTADSGVSFVTSDGTANDGSEVPEYVLAEDVDATDGAIEGIVYRSGHFRGAALTFAGTHTLASLEASLRTRNIHID